MNSKDFCFVIGARPNFIKAWPLINSVMLEGKNSFDIVHSGQHFDKNMSDDILIDLNFPKIDRSMKISNEGASRRYSELIDNFINYFRANSYKLVFVFGDVNTTVAASLGANQNNIEIAHIESGLRSFDVTMPEEINRIIVDNLSSKLFVTESSAKKNLIMEKFDKRKIFFVGNLMIETLIKKKEFWMKEKPIKEKYILLTCHRAENIYDASNLRKIVELIINISKKTKILFPIHPATKKMLVDFNLFNKLKNKNIDICEPVGYFKFINLIFHSEGVITDSGGIQEEAVFLGKNIVTLRKNTERPITLKTGFNKLFSIEKSEFKNIEKHIYKNVSNKKKIKFWDSKVSERILRSI